MLSNQLYCSDGFNFKGANINLKTQNEQISLKHKMLLYKIGKMWVRKHVSSHLATLKTRSTGENTTNTILQSTHFVADVVGIQRFCIAGLG